MPYILSCGMYDLKRHLMDDYDIPYVIIVSGMNDPRKLNETHTLNQIESFIEILRQRNKS